MYVLMLVSCDCGIDSMQEMLLCVENTATSNAAFTHSTTVGVSYVILCCVCVVTVSSECCRYKQLNVCALDVICSYNTDIPVFLHNHLPKFIGLKRMPPAVDIPLRNISQVERGVFDVKSESCDRTYGVYIESTDTVSAPWCHCTDWLRRHLPCKHILAVFTYFPEWSWDHLPSEYMSLSVFTFDPDLLTEVQQTCHLSQEEVQNAAHSSPVTCDEEQPQGVPESTEQSQVTSQSHVPLNVLPSSTHLTNLQRRLRVSLFQ